MAVHSQSSPEKSRQASISPCSASVVVLRGPGLSYRLMGWASNPHCIKDTGWGSWGGKSRGCGSQNRPTFHFSFETLFFPHGECRAHVSGMFLGPKVRRPQLRDLRLLHKCSLSCSGLHYKWFTFFHLPSGRGKHLQCLPQILIYSVINLKGKLISLLSLTTILEQRGD